jgi:hypothetical protein
MRTAETTTPEISPGSGQAVIMLRIGTRLASRLDKIALKLGERQRAQGQAHKVGRATVMRVATLQGLPELERALDSDQYVPAPYSPITKPTVVMLRITSELADRLNILAGKLVKWDKNANENHRVGRATIMREAMLLGLPMLESQLRKTAD